ncbi:hypothetical protein V2J09_009984 [Rumex salicifolius]
MSFWNWRYRSRRVVESLIHPLMPTWRMQIKKEIRSKARVDVKTMTSTWTEKIFKNINVWNEYDAHTIMKFLMIRQQIKIITWNTQGAGSRMLMRTLKDIIRTHDPTILVLVETRLSGPQADKVCKEIGFDGIVRAQAVGFKGGIWVLWRKDRVKLTVQDMFHQAVTLEVERAGEDSWVFSAIYASPQLNSRQELWDRLLGLKLDISKPWLLMGDFNETINMAERTGDSDCMRRRCDRFSSWVNDMELLDMGYSGPQYTWFRGVDEDSRTAARLDRGLCSVEWQDYFGEASIKNLGRNQSNHCPILMDSYGFSQGNVSSHPFRFQAAWTLHDEFQEYVAQNWNHNVQLPEALANLADHLTAWNRDVFGNLFRSRDRLWRRIEGIQRSLSVAWSVGLVKLEKKS